MTDIDKLTATLEEVTSSLQQYTRYSLESVEELRSLMRNIMTGNTPGVMDAISALQHRGQTLIGYTKEVLNNPNLLADPTKGLISIQQQQQQNAIAMQILAMRQEIEAQNAELQRLQAFQQDYNKGYQLGYKLKEFGKEKWAQYQDYQRNTFESLQAGDVTGLVGRGMSAVGDFVGGDNVLSSAIFGPGMTKLWFASQPIRWAGRAILGISEGLQKSFLTHGTDSQLVDYIQESLGMSREEAISAAKQLQGNMASLLGEDSETSEALIKNREDVRNYTETLRDTIAALSQTENADVSANELVQLVEGVAAFKKNINHVYKYASAVKELFTSDQLRMLSSSIVGMSKSIRDAQYMMDSVIKEKNFLLNRGVSAAEFIDHVSAGINLSQDLGIGVRAGIRTSYDISQASALFRQSILGNHVTQSTIQAGLGGLAQGTYTEMSRYSSLLGGPSGINQQALAAYQAGDYAGMLEAAGTMSLEDRALYQFDPTAFNRQVSDAMGSPIAQQARRVRQLLKIMGRADQASVLSAINRVTGGDYSQNQALFAYLQNETGNRHLITGMETAANFQEPGLLQRIGSSVMDEFRQIGGDVAYEYRDIMNSVRDLIDTYGKYSPAGMALSFGYNVVNQAVGLGSNVTLAATSMGQEIMHQASNIAGGVHRLVTEAIPTTFARVVSGAATAVTQDMERGASFVRDLSPQGVGQILAQSYSLMTPDQRQSALMSNQARITELSSTLGLEYTDSSKYLTNSRSRAIIDEVANKIFDEFVSKKREDISNEIRSAVIKFVAGDNRPRVAPGRSNPSDVIGIDFRSGTSSDPTGAKTRPDLSPVKESYSEVAGFEEIKAKVFSVEKLIVDCRKLVIRRGLSTLIQVMGGGANGRKSANQFLTDLGGGDLSKGKIVFYDMVTDSILKNKYAELSQLEAFGVAKLVEFMQKNRIGNIEGFDLESINEANEFVRTFQDEFATELQSYGVSSSASKDIITRLASGDISTEEQLNAAVAAGGGTSTLDHQAVSRAMQYKKKLKIVEEAGKYAISASGIGGSPEGGPEGGPAGGPEGGPAGGPESAALEINLANSIAQLSSKVQSMNTASGRSSENLNFTEAARLFAESVAVFGQSAVKLGKAIDSEEIKSNPENKDKGGFLSWMGF